MNKILKERKYKNKKLIESDISNAIAGFDNLVPRECIVKEPLTGKERDIICLDGTIPVLDKGVLINVPIVVHIFRGYPDIAPDVLVKPDRSMVLLPNHYVNGDGRMFLPMLTSWKDQKPQPDLLTLVGMVQQVFSKSCPVCPKPKSSQISKEIVEVAVTVCSAVVVVVCKYPMPIVKEVAIVRWAVFLLYIHRTFQQRIPLRIV